jgi:hypothetical protein
MRWGLATLVVILQAGTLSAQGTSIRPLEQELARLESAQLREGNVRLYIPPDEDWLAGARRQVEAHLKANPDDPSALVLFARVGRFVLDRSRGAHCTPAHGCIVDSSFNDSAYHAALDRALQLRPDHAATHFWKALLVEDGRPVIRDGEFEVDVDTAQLLEHAGHAVKLEPRNVRYREFLATRLTDMGRYDQAVTVIREVDRGKHPLHLILQDFAALPLPPGAVLWPGRALFMAVGLTERPPRYAAQTGRAWALAMTKEQLEAFYRRSWPGFRFFERGLGEGGAEPKVWVQHFRGDRGKLQPARDSAAVVLPEGHDGFEGMLMVVRRAGPSVDMQGDEYPEGFAGRSEFLEIIVLNGRTGN